ncbi:putative DNA-binding transcriptional regulator YafY [Sphaerotilus hippei]|uniref:Putative DNA-binding transcriptional regulator YafY n=1 Tax=Sphaerotilus hippei TaxID=744406 RepID=A0A318GYT3_9BURK|nr:WYL domain-containing protein [Sphaerotilus hippei]PXW93902.1 putative DNA-binding transcriptional regulator YafY [Sphaerotilus hippei]
MRTSQGAAQGSHAAIALELLRRIPRVGHTTAQQLRDQLAAAGIVRDERTLQRQLKRLIEQFDIECDDRSKPHAYRWKSHAATLSMQRLTSQESLLLTLAEQHLNSLLPPTLMKSMAGFFAQARSNVDPRAPHEAPYANDLDRQWRHKVRVVSETQPLLPPQIDPQVFDAVSHALYLNHWLNIEYRNAAKALVQARVMPLGLAQQGPRLYLVVRFEGYDNERSLALHRIVRAEVGPSRFDPPPGFDLQRYDEDGRFGFGEGEKIRLKFRIEKAAGQHLLETPLSEDQTCVEGKTHLTFTATVVRSEQLRWWIRSFGNAISTTSPRTI